MAVRRRCLLLGCLCMLLCLLLPVQAQAAETSLTVHYDHDDVIFSIFLAAESGENGRYTPAGDFSNFPVEIPGESWRTCAATLAAYAVRDELVPVSARKIQNGTAVFGGLNTGLYLIIGQTHTGNGCRFTPVPVLVDVSASGATANCKFDQDPENPGQTISCTAEKVWRSDALDQRPGSVEIQLLRDGEVCDTVRLSSDNSWRHTWNDLPDSHLWQVTEAEVPEGYTVSISQTGHAFTVTNTRHGTPDQPTDPSSPTKPGSSDTPKTGDDTQIAPYIFLLIVGICGMIALWLDEKREKQ